MCGECVCGVVLCSTGCGHTQCICNRGDKSRGWSLFTWIYSITQVLLLFVCVSGSVCLHICVSLVIFGVVSLTSTVRKCQFDQFSPAVCGATTRASNRQYVKHGTRAVCCRKFDAIAGRRNETYYINYDTYFSEQQIYIVKYKLRLIKWILALWLLCCCNYFMLVWLLFFLCVACIAFVIVQDERRALWMCAICLIIQRHLKFELHFQFRTK